MKIIRLFEILTICIFCALVACNSKSLNNGKTITSLDTVYLTDPAKDAYFVKPLIKLRTDTIGDSPYKLNLNTENFVQISVHPYTQYPIFLKNLQNVEVQSLDSNKGNFYIVPTDSICQFDIYLDFGRGNAILKYDKSDSSGYGYKAFEGLQLMARIEEEIN